MSKGDKIKVETGSRYLNDPSSEMSGTKATFRHRYIRGDNIGFDMGPKDGKIFVGTNTSSNFDTYLRTDAYRDSYSNLLNRNTVEVSASGLIDAIEVYQDFWGNQPYIATSYNSNYAVNTAIYSAGGSVPGNTEWTPQFK